jgi:hypothetical protein
MAALSRRCFKGRKHSPDEVEWINANKNCMAKLRRFNCIPR